MAYNEKRYCPSCGSLVVSTALNCPNCGMRLIQPDGEDDPENNLISSADATQRIDFSQQNKRVMGVHSALPSKEELKQHNKKVGITLRVIIVSIIACVAIVCTALVLIFHPWDPSAYQSRTRTPADTSQEGFPGTIDSLSGQDG